MVNYSLKLCLINAFYPELGCIDVLDYDGFGGSLVSCQFDG
jgi:hypothetical protein